MIKNLKNLTILICIICFANTSFSQKKIINYKTEVELDGSLFLTTFLQFTNSGSDFKLNSPKNADVRLVGALKSRIGRVMKKSPKKGILLKIQGVQKGDSLIGTLKIAYIGNFVFVGKKEGVNIQGEFRRNDTLIGVIHGRISEDERLYHAELGQNVMDTVNQYIYSKNVLKTSEWKTFEKDFRKLSTKAHDDIELAMWFFMNNSKLPFSHFYLLPNPKAADSEEEEENDESGVVFKEQNKNTAYIKIDDFSSTTADLAKILPKIVENENYKNLIIDLRNNPGGGIEAANEFAKHLIHGKANVGCFVSQKFQFESDTLAAMQRLPEFNPKTTEEFVELMKNSQGAKLIIDNASDNPIFGGKIYVLINNSTGSTCEPIVYYLKKNGLATIVGEKTAGAMLSASFFKMNEKYYLILPVADYYTPDLVRLDQVGVSPDIETKSEDALTKTLEIISN